ncbi:MAG: hypothetical protein ABIJ35_00775 [Acidobacteriota bacterium]|nr:hypothetical protein [Pseudomonadota bacterium]
MAVVDQNDRELLRRMTKEDVIRAMDLFDKKLRSTFEDNRWRDYIVPYNGKNYPPKDLLRCVIAIMKEDSYERDSVKGGGFEINKYFKKIGFQIIDIKEK